jgi:uncharacterized protein YdbL (DUF1318 family)
MKLELKKMLTIVFAALAITLAFAAPSAHAADSKSEKAKLRARSESRYPEVRKYKSAGKVGETSEGFLEAVKESDAALGKLIDEENADRRALYQLISKDQGANVDAVARKAAQINFRDAKKGDYLKDGDQWRQK